MIKSNITPGKWSWQGTGKTKTKVLPRLSQLQAFTGSGLAETVLVVDGEVWRDDPDVRAIAAVPDLLEALELALELVGTAQKHFPKSIKNSDRFQLELSRAAIKKALIKAGYTLD